MSVVDGLPFADEKKEYILKTLDPILEELVSDVLTEMPQNPSDFMIAWLKTRCGAHTSHMSIVKLNEALKHELKHVTTSLQEAGRMVPTNHPVDESDPEESDDELGEMEEPPLRPTPTGPRKSVSAEAYGAWNQKRAFSPPVHPKTEEQNLRLRHALADNFMFSGLQGKDMEIVLGAFEESKFEADERVIEQGECGDFMFVIEEGALNCFKDDVLVKTCEPGDVFGELALLYNCPRAASVVARQACTCWKLDRETFTHIVKDAATEQRQRRDEFLRNVPIFSSMDPSMRSQIAECLTPETFHQNNVIVQQGTPGEKFYIVEEGTLYAVKEDDNQDPKRVMDYHSGDCFGELSLLRHQPRAASVIVESEYCKLLSMSHNSFNKMCGPLNQILQNQVTSYH